MPRHAVKCGIIGAGKIAWTYDKGRIVNGQSTTHMSCFKRHPDTKLISIFEPNSDARQAVSTAYPNLKVFSVLDDFLDQNLDLISICSPNKFHAKHLTACLKTSAKYIWAEKPATDSLTEFRRLLETINILKSPPRINVNFFRRNLIQFGSLKNECKKQKPIQIEINYSQSLQTNGVHLIDILGFILDVNYGNSLLWCRGDKTNNPSFGLEINGIPITVTGMNLSYHCIDIRVTFEDRRITLSKGGENLIVEMKMPNPSFPGFYHLEIDETAQNIFGFDPLIEGTYLNLCNLLDDDADLYSSFMSSAFSQDILNKVRYWA